MKTSCEIIVARAWQATDDVRALLGELDYEFGRHYPPEQRHGLKLDAIFAADVRFYMAQVSGIAVGCGGVALFENFAELKRMFVRPSVRGQGVADAILTALTREARAAGFMLPASDGTAQTAAVRFYSGPAAR